MINEKDAPILAAAIAAHVDWLLSLDKHFLLENWAGRVNFRVCSPVTFLNELRSILD
jgi:predicted nucleic acid-binding protein